MIGSQVFTSQCVQWFSRCLQTDYSRLLCTQRALFLWFPSKDSNVLARRELRSGTKSSPSSHVAVAILRTTPYYCATFSWDSVWRPTCVSEQTPRALIHGWWLWRIKTRCNFGRAWLAPSSIKTTREFIDSIGLWTAYLTTGASSQIFNLITALSILSGTCTMNSNGKLWSKAISIWFHLLRVSDTCNLQIWFYTLVKRKRPLKVF